MGKLSKKHTILLITFLILVWGANWPLSKFALSYTPPILFSGIRTLLGGLALLAVAVPRYKRLRLKETYPVFLLSALFNVILYYGLQTIGLQHLPSGLFSAIVFLQPVLVGIFSWMWLGETMTGLKIAGLLSGFAGVGIICSGAGTGGHVSVPGVSLAIGSALSWALGTVYVKKNGPRVDPIWLVTLQLLIGGLLMTLAGTGLERWSDIAWRPPFLLSLAFISTFVIAAGWIVFYKLIDSGEATKVASFTFLIPLTAILMATVFLHEPLTATLAVGLLFIVGGIYLVNRRPPPAGR